MTSGPCTGAVLVLESPGVAIRKLDGVAPSHICGPSKSLFWVLTDLRRLLVCRGHPCDMPSVGTAILPSSTSAAVLYSPLPATAPTPSLLGLTRQPRKRQPTSRGLKSFRLCVQAVNSSLDDVQMRSRDEASSSDDFDRVQLDSSIQLPEGTLFLSGCLLALCHQLHSPLVAGMTRIMLF